MRHGLKGIQCCACAFDVWGLSCDAPNLQPLAGSDQYFDAHSDPPGRLVLPDVGDPGPEGTSWTFSAAKVPSSYPYTRCEVAPPLSSADPKATEQWSVGLGSAGRVFEREETPGNPTQVYKDFRVAYSSRVICVDGVQEYVTYTITPNGRITLGDDYDRAPEWNAHAMLKDHVQVNIGNKDAVTYNVDHLNKDPNNISTTSLMEYYWIEGAWWSGNPSNNVFYPQNGSFIGPAQQLCYGKQFFSISNYVPFSQKWGVGKLEYDGMVVVTTGAGDGALPGVTEYVGDYVLVLPAIRVNIDSSMDPELSELWWSAKNGLDRTGESETISNKLVLGRWANTDMRGLDSDPFNDQADGTLQEAEVEVVVVDGSNPPVGADFTGETFENIQVRCYNRVYDPATGHNRDLVLFTTDPPESTDLTAEPLADFEVESGTGFDPDYLNSGIDEFGLQFTQSASEIGNKWIADNGDFHDGSYSALANINAINNGHVSLSITFNVVDTDVVTFWYLHDNRYSGDRGNFIELTNQPDVDNTLEVFLDGAHVDLTIDDVPYVHGVDGVIRGVIDNVNQPSGWDNTEEFFLTWRKVSVPVQAGTRTLRISLFRRFADDNGNLNSRIDEMQFPELLLGDDTNGYRRWFWDGTKLRRAKWWAWPIRYNENTPPDDIFSRISTLPDFITLAQDGSGRILYGNSHYIYCLKYDEGEDEWFPDPDFATDGVFAFSASQYIQPPTEYLNSECEWVSILRAGPFDTVNDPPYGQMQILVTKSNIQLRGMNGNWRDRTTDGVPFDLFPDERFGQLLSGAVSWSNRIHGWTLSYDGKEAKPHVEVIWRVPMEEKSWPEAPPYDSTVDGPYHPRTESDSADLVQTIPFGYPTPGYEDFLHVENARVRDPSKLEDEGDMRKPQWTNINKIVSRIYADTYGRSPQHIWTRNPAQSPPDETINGGADPNPEFYTKPWPEAQFRIVPAYHCPTSAHMLSPLRPLEVSCEVGAGEEDFHYVWDTFCPRGSENEDEHHGGYSDFDAVDCDCGCGCC